MSPATSLIVGTIGLTTTTLAWATPTSDGPQLGPPHALDNRSYPDLATLLGDFCGSTAAAAILVPFCHSAPRSGEAGSAPWSLRGQGDLSLRLLPPAQALAWAIPALDPTELHQINPNALPAVGCALAVVPGWTLDEALVIETGGRQQVLPSAGGGVAFAPGSPADVELLHFLQDQYGYADYEAICTYAGLLNIYRHLIAVGFATEPPWVSELLAASDNPAQTILAVARDRQRSASICTEAVERLGIMLGAHVGNLALVLNATGGVYLGGELLEEASWVLESEWFLDAFVRHGPSGEQLARTPLLHVRDPLALLRGAARAGLGAG